MLKTKDVNTLQNSAISVTNLPLTKKLLTNVFANLRHKWANKNLILFVFFYNLIIYIILMTANHHGF